MKTLTGVNYNITDRLVTIYGESTDAGGDMTVSFKVSFDDTEALSLVARLLEAVNEINGANR